MTKKLKIYENKRNFNITKEPKAKTTQKTDKKLKFVIQHHLARKDHYDLRLEHNGVFLSWAVPKGPPTTPKEKHLAIMVENHPLSYGDFEGTIPKGQYGGGIVMLWDKGFYKPSKKNVYNALKNGVLKFELLGKRLKGKWTLIKTNKDNDKNWILIKTDNLSINDINNYKTSIKTGRTMSQIENNEKTNNISAKKILKMLNEIKTNDTCQIGEIKITNPQKQVFKNIKKVDILKYYTIASKRILPFLENRIISIVRCPNGIKGESFFKKHPSVTNSGLLPFKVKNSNSENEEFFYIQNIWGLLLEAQMNTIEFHTWGCSIDKINMPDCMVFDLDPDEKLKLDKVRDSVLDLKKILNSLNLKSFLKTSGKKGFHVVVPFMPCVDWNKFHDFAKSVALLLEAKYPQKYTTNIRKINRKGKIFVDFERNTKGATSICPYSLRIKENLTISMPIFWKELKNVTPNKFNITNSLERIKSIDPWKKFFKIKQKLQ